MIEYSNTHGFRNGLALGLKDPVLRDEESFVPYGKENL